MLGAFLSTICELCNCSSVSSRHTSGTHIIVRRIKKYLSFKGKKVAINLNYILNKYCIQICNKNGRDIFRLVVNEKEAL